MNTKTKHLILLLILIFSVSTLSGCSDFWEDEEDYETSQYDDHDYDDDEDDEEDNGDSDHGHGHSKPEENSDLQNIEPIDIDSDAKSATVLIYMNGSDLETKAGEASNDIAEMLGSGAGRNVNVLIQTMGTKKWQDFGISSSTSQIYKVKGRNLELLESDLGQLECARSKTLSDFISYGKKNYPADRYILIFWDHGGGPVYGFGYDEWRGDSDALTLDEIRDALEDNSDISFDIIGMDCCIMASLETCYVLSPYCRYAILSEDFESGLGWAYTNWLKMLEESPGVSSAMLGKKIIDDMIADNENDPYAGASSTMIMVNEKVIPEVMDEWIKFAYENEESLLDSNFSKQHLAKGRSRSKGFWDFWDDDSSYVTMEDFYVSDILSIVESAGSQSQTTENLKASLKTCAAYFGHTSDKNELTGLAISLPYGNSEYYSKQAKIYSNCGIDSDYIKWLKQFVSADGSDNYYDYDEFEESWDGWEEYEEGWASCETDEDFEDWEYDYEEDIWYCYEDGYIYLYDEESELLFIYDEEYDELYYYDEDDDEWYLVEDDEECFDDDDCDDECYDDDYWDY
ncbi:MAG: hypothetical protein K6A38_08380 [Lachnospiraceae bacterium]|nr:hypothetical protein [Lachnospiraceae bacterium]